jgi:DnaA family protein
MLEQMSFEFDESQEFRLEQFVVQPENRMLMTSIQRMLAPQESLPGMVTGLMLVGPRGAGVTHLLAGCCQELMSQGRRALYLDLAHHDPADFIEDEPLPDLMCLDHLERLRERSRQIETDTFHLVNRVRAAGALLMFGCRETPQNLKWMLPDLRTRLQWYPLFQVRPLDEEGKLDLLCGHARLRGISLDEGNARYILKKGSRDVRELSAELALLDEAAMSSHRRITKPLIRHVLGR